MKLKPKTKAQWRVAIMRDVIKQLGLRAIIAQSGTYLRVEERNLYGSLNQETLLSVSAPQCKVCMLGATFLSAVRLDNKFEGRFGHVGSFDMHVRLESYFTANQRAIIENVFEGSAGDGAEMALFDKLGDETRLRFIASFIVKRKGLFSGREPGSDLEKAAASFGRSEARKKSKAVKALA